MYRRILFLTYLSTALAQGLNAQTHDNEDEGSSYSPLVEELDPLNSERTAFDPMIQLQLNWTRPGKRRGPRRSLPRFLLEARQNTSQCNPSNYVLVCPITEHSPCCPPDFLVCCHDPSDTCCPVGTFCTGLQTCCVNGAIGCGESCCPAGLVCGTINGAQTCVDPSASTVAAPTTATASTTRGQGGGSETTTGGAGVGSGASSSVSFADPAYTPSDPGEAKVNTAVIGGAVGGGVVALILIALLAWYLLRQKKNTKGVSEPAGPESIPTPYTNGQPSMAAVTVMHDSSPAYPEGHAPPVVHKANHPWSQNSSGAVSGFPYGGSVTQGTSYGNSSNPAPPGSVGGRMTMSDAGSSGVVGPGGYVPPPPEDIPTTTSPGPGGSYYGGPTTYGSTGMSPTSAYSSSQPNAMSAAGTAYSSNPPWVSGLGSPSIEQQQQQQQRYSQQQNPPWTSGISSSTHDQQPHSPPQPQQPQLQPQQSLQVHQAPPQPWLHPGLAPSPGPMTPPPPPFSPGPFGPPLEGSSGGGRVVPMTAPADRKAKPTKGTST